MKDLPYFRWYTADAKADEKYAAMTDQELGFYHRCLNHSWDNNGLPADLDEVARLLHVSRPYFNKVWAKVGRCFVERDGRLFNKRQERERERALGVSENNKRPGNANASKPNADESREKREREKNGFHARGRADSDSESASDSQKKKTSLREVPKGLPDPGCQDFGLRFDRLYIAHPKAGFEFEARTRYIADVTSAVNPDREADLIDAAAERWRAFWIANPSEFVPTLARWFEDKYHLKEPIAREPPKTRQQKNTDAWDSA